MNTKLNYRAFKLYILLLSSVLLCRCNNIKEDFEICKELVVVYQYNMPSVGFTEIDFIETIDYVYIYVFDKDLKLFDQLTISSAQFKDNVKITVPESYLGNTLVAMAHETHNSYDVPVMKVGDSIDKLTLRLKTTANNISTTRLADLFHSGEKVMTFEDGEGTKQKIPVYSTTKQINLKLTNASNTNITTRYDVELIAGNGYYGYDYSIVPDNPMITYQPYNKILITDENPVFNLRTLRFVEEYRDEVILTVVERATGRSITFGDTQELKLIDYLLKTTPLGMSNQEYLDVEHSWDLSMTVSTDINSVISITIDDWTTWFNNVEL